MSIRLGLLSHSYISPFSNLQKHLFYKVSHATKTKKGENERAHFVFHDVSMANRLIAFCILYGSLALGFSIFFFWRWREEITSSLR